MPRVYFNYTSQEKTDYKIQMYIRDLCKRLDVECPESIIFTISDIMKCISKTHGGKRLKLKDTIIIVCLSKLLNLDSESLCSKLDIENKYISNTYKIFVEIPELRGFIHNISAYEYVRQIYIKNKNFVSHLDPLEKTKELLDLCEQYDILTENSCITIGVTCLYYILIKDGYEIDLDKFTSVYCISKTTILKALKKLQQGLDKSSHLC